MDTGIFGSGSASLVPARLLFLVTLSLTYRLMSPESSTFAQEMKMQSFENQMGRVPEDTDNGLRIIGIKGFTEISFDFLQPQKE
ncbi:hypothetical protein RHMOL_Rhmol05G0102900 [Rhododendron molle]|uniref:Uncharacterized protein n=1 Tax=Rhododendron molle TaxID=49168 RepID=A0ACC0NPR0_RHOML|nr:hypothetical protein RHMOL_Rhmol05G0102900 [Rhododendron molle]